MRLHVRDRKSYVPVAERRAIEQARALAACKRGQHSMTNTFRPSEQVCTVCGLVTYCPACLEAAHLARPQRTHAYAMECSQHRLPARAV